MNINTIKFETVKFINGLKYLPKSHINNIQHLVCDKLNVEKTEENFNAIKEGIKIYFLTLNSMEIPLIIKKQ